MVKIKLSKEEKEERKLRQQQIRQLWQSAGIRDIARVESLVQEIYTAILRTGTHQLSWWFCICAYKASLLASALRAYPDLTVRPLLTTHKWV